MRKVLGKSDSRSDFFSNGISQTMADIVYRHFGDLIRATHLEITASMEGRVRGQGDFSVDTGGKCEATDEKRKE